jgi:hypothetical protein
VCSLSFNLTVNKAECPTPHNGHFTPRKRWFAHYTEGLMSRMTVLFLPTDCFIHNVLLNEVKIDNT